jgi:hypothetical protein
MLGAGTVIGPILKIVTTVAILGAAYLFIVKPVLDTTDSVIDRSFDAFGESFEGLDELPGQIQSNLDDALESSDDPKALKRCIKRAIADNQLEGARIDRCTERFG